MTYCCFNLHEFYPEDHLPPRTHRRVPWSQIDPPWRVCHLCLYLKLRANEYWSYIEYKLGFFSQRALPCILLLSASTVCHTRHSPLINPPIPTHSQIPPANINFDPDRSTSTPTPTSSSAPTSRSNIKTTRPFHLNFNSKVELSNSTARLPRLAQAAHR